MQKVLARGEAFKIPQIIGNLFVCAEENGGCCCGHVEKGRATVNKDLYAQLWEDHNLRNKVHLTFVGCLGPCPVGNNAMLLIYGQSIWFKDLNADRFIGMIYDYIDASLAAGKVIEPTGELVEHIYQRYQPTSSLMGQTAVAGLASTNGAEDVAEEDFDGIDPVCMMPVDPATAAWKSEFNGKTYSFCAPSCKRAFDKAPTAYVKATASSNNAHAVKDSEHDSKPVFEIAKEQMMSQTNQTNESANAETKVFSVPNISCAHCVRSIKNEISEIAGVTEVQANEQTKVVTVAWEAPATWDQIKAALTEIDYPPQELLQL